MNVYEESSIYYFRVQSEREWTLVGNDGRHLKIKSVSKVF